jgi:hypothetical protein
VSPANHDDVVAFSHAVNLRASPDSAADSQG